MSMIRVDNMDDGLNDGLNIADPLHAVDDGRGWHWPEVGPRSTWVCIRAGGRMYRSEAAKVVPLSDGRLLQWPQCFPQLTRDSTLGELIALVGHGCRRVIWHPVEDFLRIPDGVVLYLDKPRMYTCVQRSAGRREQMALGTVTYSGPNPTTGHGIGQFEVAFGGRFSPYRLTCDRLSEAQHLMAVAFGLTQRDSAVSYLCELP